MSSTAVARELLTRTVYSMFPSNSSCALVSITTGPVVLLDSQAATPRSCFTNERPPPWRGPTSASRLWMTSAIGAARTWRPLGARCVISMANRLSMRSGNPLAPRVTDLPSTDTVRPLTWTGV